MTSSAKACVGDREAGVRLRVLVPLAIGLMVLTAAAVAVREDEYHEHLNAEAAERTAIARAAVEKQFHENVGIMHALLQGIAADGELSNAYRTGDRQLLHQTAQPRFEEMRKRVRISHFYFHGPDRRVFLRMHKPESHGDVIDRRTLLNAQESGAPAVGFERGPFAAFAQRAVWPWRVGGEVIGYLELSMDLEDTAAALRAQLGINLFAVVNKEMINRQAWEDGLKQYQRKSDWDEFDEVVVMDRTAGSVPEPVAGYLNSHSTADYEILHLENDGAAIAQVVPIADVRGDKLASLVVLTDISDVADNHRHALLQVFAVCTSVSLALIVFFFVFFGRVESRLGSRRRALEHTNRALAEEIKERQRAENALRQERAHLEVKVLERTSELSHTNESLRREIAARAQAESDLDLMFATTPDMIVLGGADGLLKRINPAMAEFTGYTEEELLTTPFIDFVDPEHLPRVYQDLAKLADGESVHGFYLRTRHKDGHWLETEWNSVPLGERGGFLSVGRDVSQRMAVERRLLDANEALKCEVKARAKAESELDLMFSTTPDMLALGGFDGRFKRVNPAMTSLSGYSEEELLSKPFTEFIDPDQLPAVGERMEHLAAGEEIHNMYLRVRHKDGHFLETEWHNVPFLDKGLFLTVGRDISQRMDAKRRLIAANDALKAEVSARAAAQRELDQLFTSSLDLLCLAGLDGYIKRVNPSFCNALGYTEEELLALPFMGLVYPDDLRLAQNRLALLADGVTLTEVVVRICTKDGRVRHTQWNLVPLGDSGMLYATGRDITDIKELEESLRETAAKLYDAQRIGKVGSWEADLRTGESEWSDETLRIYGFEPNEVTPTMDFFFSMVHPEDRDRVRNLDDAPPKDGEHRLHEHRIVLRDGTVRDLLVNIEFSCDEAGRPYYLRGTCQDITERKEAERKQALLEERLRVSQKMDAIGALAGGIAHDFNNLMSVILTYVGFVQDTLASGDPILDDLGEVEKAADRAATLTRQLLAFGRKQVFQPVPLDLNDVAEGLEKMLRRVIGENIELVKNLAPNLGATIADPSQLEQVLMNLVINARDAMPGGGLLTIETANIEVCEEETARDGIACSAEPMHPGSYVMVSVTDTGCGMDAQTRAHLFEPFFTTKEVGKGTGLGLPTVYGIVKQSKGFIRVESEPGHGSTFAIYLPREKNGTALIRRKPTEAVPAVGDETILVVEDEPAVRNSAVRILRDAGYEVLAASNGREALELCGSHQGDIHLVLTDVVMPEMNGAELARYLAELRPDTRVLFMSGYSGDAIAEQGVLDRDTHLITKPFNAADLTTRIREVLDIAAAAAGNTERQVS